MPTLLVTVVSAENLARPPWSKPIGRRAIAAGAASQSFPIHRAAGPLILGDPPVFGYLDGDRFLLPAEQFRDVAHGEATAGAAIRSLDFAALRMTRQSTA